MFKTITRYYKGMAKNPFTYMAIVAYMIAMLSSEPGSRDFSTIALVALVSGFVFFLIAEALVAFSVTKEPAINSILEAINSCESDK